MLSLVPAFRSQIIIIIPFSCWSDGFVLSMVGSVIRREANKNLSTEQSPSTEEPGFRRDRSIKMVRRAQFSLRTAWFGQQLLSEGNRGGATRWEGSRIRQSPLKEQGSLRQFSFRDGTQTSCWGQLPLDLLPFLPFVSGRKQLVKPHQRFVQRAVPFSQTHALQYSSTWPARILAKTSWLVFRGEYGDIVPVVLIHTDFGSESTANFQKSIKLR